MLVPDAPVSFDHYDIERLLGRGAMGTVYLARDRRIGRRVALKTIQLGANQFPDETAANEFYVRLQREAEVSGSLQHPSIVTLYEVGYADSRVSYLAMEWIEGETLLALLKRLKPVPVVTVIQIAEDLLRGLAHAHEKSVIHRDIKPANILITTDGTAKIADFGIARPVDSSMTGAGALIGTPNYMAPEQILGKTPSTKADVFSLGVVLYEMLTGIKPFAGDGITAILHNVLRQEAPGVSELNPLVSRPLSDLVARLMTKASEGRPGATEALAELAGLREPAAVEKAAVVVQTSPSLIRYAVIAVITLAICAGLLGLFWSLIDGSPTVVIPQVRLDEYAAKRQALGRAEAALNAGRFDESTRLYDAYLAKYPDSVTAIEGRDLAATAVEETEKSRKKPVKRRSRSRGEEDISPAELLRRLRRAINR